MICTQNKDVQECMHLRQQTFCIHIQLRWVFMVVLDLANHQIKELINFVIHNQIMRMRVFVYY